MCIWPETLNTLIKFLLYHFNQRNLHHFESDFNCIDISSNLKHFQGSHYSSKGVINLEETHGRAIK